MIRQAANALIYPLLGLQNACEQSSEIFPSQKSCKKQDKMYSFTPHKYESKTQYEKGVEDFPPSQ